MKNSEWKKWLFWFTFAVATIAVFKTIDSVYVIFEAIGKFFNILIPFFSAILVAYILYMPCKKMEVFFGKLRFKFFKKHKRGFSILITYVISLFIIYLIIAFIVPIISESVTDLVKSIPEFYNSAMNYYESIDEDSWLVRYGIVDYLKSFNDFKIEDELDKWLDVEHLAGYAKGLVGFTGIIFDIFVTIVVSIYMLLERTYIKEFSQRLFKALLGNKVTSVINKYYRKTSGLFFNFIKLQLVDACIVGILTSIVMSLMKVKYAVLLGFLIGLFNIIPYFGAIVAVIIAVIITIFTGGFSQAIWLTLIVTAVQQIDSNIINPKLLGNSLNLSPILVIFSVTVGGAYWGIIGMFLAVPCIGLVKIIIQDVIESKEMTKQERIK